MTLSNRKTLGEGRGDEIITPTPPNMRGSIY